MFRFLVAFALFATPAMASDPVHYCNDDLPYDVSAVDDGFIIWQRPENAVCVRVDATWFECDKRADYRVAFQISEDGSELYLWTPLFKEGERETFRKCQ